MSESTPTPRPSRQDLVVPPRQSNLAAAIGAILCAAAGFGLVWAFGIGRSPIADTHGPDAPEVASTPPDNAAPASFDARSASLPPQPDLLPPIDDAIPVRSRFGSAPEARPVGHDEPPVDRSPATTAPLDNDHAVIPTSAETDLPPPRFARYGSSDLPPAELEPLSHDADAPPAIEDDSAPMPNAMSRADDVLDPVVEDAPLPEDAGDLPADPVPPVDVATSPADDAAPPPAPSPPPAAAAFGAAPPAFASTPPAPFPEPSAPAPAAPAMLPPPSASVSMTAAPVAPPFAAAPPVAMHGQSAELRPGTSLPSDHAPVPGRARPGPMQLEGIQTPQVSVEKRGPREISVGKPARYEIIVRNVGSATAHDVVLRDAVPQGTALIATTPPASPLATASGDADGTLVWSLGALQPGGQSVVTMEVMPQAEGDIGSVASVSFRADASVRSRATKPDLRIECTPPEPVLIGRDMQVSLTVTNPGTGVATGVVLEAFLPENVSHRSGSELEFDVGQLRPGESRTIDLVLGTRGPGIHPARLSARADGGVEALNEVPIEVTAPTLELAVDMPLRRFLQRPATCRIAMNNGGTASARAIELAAQLPPGMKFVKANNAGWHDERTHRVLWNLEELPPGEMGTVEVVVMPVELGPQKIVAAARSADGLSDQVSHTCDVEGLAALSFEVVDSEDPIEVDGVTEYVVRVGNQGTKPATGVRLAATLLGDLEPVEAQGPGGHRVDNLTVSFEPLAKLAPAEEAVFRIRAKGRRAGDQRIQVQLTSADQPAPITKEEITRVYADR